MINSPTYPMVVRSMRRSTFRMVCLVGVPTQPGQNTKT